MSEVWRSNSLVVDRGWITVHYIWIVLKVAVTLSILFMENQILGSSDTFPCIYGKSKLWFLDDLKIKRESIHNNSLKLESFLLPWNSVKTIQFSWKSFNVWNFSVFVLSSNQRSQLCQCFKWPPHLKESKHVLYYKYVNLIKLNYLFESAVTLLYIETRGVV